MAQTGIIIRARGVFTGPFERPKDSRPPLFYSTFTAADQVGLGGFDIAPAGAAWQYSTPDSWRVRLNTAKLVTGPASRNYLAMVDLTAPDQVVRTKIGVLKTAAENRRIGLAGRIAAVDGLTNMVHFAFGYDTATSTKQLLLTKVVGGVSTVIGVPYAYTEASVAPGKQLELRAIGNTVYGVLEGAVVTQATLTDAVLLDGHRAGLRSNQADPDSSVDDFEGDTLQED